MASRVAIDIGGTFTDLVHLDEGADEVGLGKVSTTVGRFEDGVMEALEGASLNGVEFLVHGTTVVINTLTERTGAVTALLTTRGFRDVLEIQKGNRPDLYNLTFRKPEPFVPRRLRLEVAERVDYAGEVLEPLDEEGVAAAVERARELGAEAIAVCFLHSYANPAHERRAGELIAAAWPGVPVTLSHRIVAEFREYHRSSTAVLDAYVKPTVASYLASLGERLGGAGVERNRRFAMRSNGGLSRFAVAAEAPIQLVESGPVGGVIGAVELGRELGRADLVTLDIGGTTAKASLIESGAARLSDGYHIERTPSEAGYPVNVPVLDITEIGAGGGSVAWLDPAGAVKVGPRSAGAEPGPACYGRGGSEPTVTDASVVAGRIDPGYFLGGRLALDAGRARGALEPIAERLGTSVEDTALGVIRIANASMIHLLRLVSVRRGRDPRRFSLVAFGGGGSMHAASLARELRIGEVIVPRAPGHFSALGMLLSDLRHDAVRTHVARLDEIDPELLAGLWAELDAGLLAAFSEEGMAADEVRLARAADMRYAGQEHAVTVSLPGEVVDYPQREEAARRFRDAHERLYGFRLEVPIELVNLRLAGFGEVRKPSLRVLRPPGANREPKGAREVLLEDSGAVEATVYERDGLAVDAELEGPAVVEEPAASTLVLPEQRLRVDDYGNLVITTKE